MSRAPRNADERWTAREESQLKGMGQELLATLKEKKLVIDWLKKQQARAGAKPTIRESGGASRGFTTALRADKLG